MNNQKKLENRKKLKHGTAAVVLTALVVIAVIVVNIVFTKLAYSNNWYVDMTKEKIYGLSDAGRELLDTIDSEAKITVHFCTPLDKLEGNDYTKMALELVKQISAEYSNVTYDYIDIVKNATAAYKYKSSSTDTVTSDSIIVESGTEFRKHSLQNLFIVDTEGGYPWAFDGESKLITSVVSVTQAEAPIAYLSTGHGESTSAVFTELLVNAGYEVKNIDLTKDEFHEDARLLVIMNPIYDFQGDPNNDPLLYSEIEKIADWLGERGNLMVFRGGLESTGSEPLKLPELDSLLAEWGIAFDTSLLLDPANSITTGADGGVSSILEGKYAQGDTLGAGMVSEIAKLTSPPKVVVPYARPLNILFDYQNQRSVSTVISSQSTAVKYSAEGTAKVGEVPVIAVSRQSEMVNNVEQNNYVYAIGSLGFAEANYLNASYANSDILYRMMRQMGRAQVPIDLKFKEFENESLDINTDEATAITWGLVLAVPAVVLTAGVIVHIRRKHA